MAVVSIARIVGLLILLSSSAANAAPTKFECRNSRGEVAADFVLDIAEGIIRRGSRTYEITSVNDDYITGFWPAWRGIGGEVIVLNRATGEYQRASISMVCRKYLNCGPRKLETLKVFGVCRKDNI
ncbi:hypothetical protein FHS21_005697 [Phyllobacterium trifolii]|uniref:Uncharacterized protein n=1 Tax=Phyllobacterium trifolii TaxID=300193 RepID=A0A839UH28_9HYPH|nr:hypothetical protein [Phyllobacterium trifolii]